MVIVVFLQTLEWPSIIKEPAVDVYIYIYESDTKHGVFTDEQTSIYTEIT